MLKTLTALLLSSTIAYGQTTPVWQVSTKTYTSPKNPKALAPIFLNTYTKVAIPASATQKNTWYQVDLKPMGVSATAKWAFLSGLLIVTHGTSEQSCNLTVSFRGVGDTLTVENYLGQVIEPHLGGGQRSGLASYVPLKNGVFEYAYNYDGDGAWPASCAYGVNLSLQAWGL